jgi:hypothetical protein
VIYEQRAPEVAAEPETEPERGPWRPADSPLADSGWLIAADDRYVAIDRIDGPLATLAVAPWPTVEPGTGRLDFGPRSERSTVAIPLRALQDRVDLDRAASGQLVRPLRPSDVFLVGGLDDDPAVWKRVLDVTRSGRLAAKASLYATAAPAPHADELTDYGLAPELAEPDREPADAGAEPDAGSEALPSGPVAYPAV